MILYPKNKDEYYSDSRETRLALRGVLDSDFHIIQPVRCPCCGGYLILLIKSTLLKHFIS